MLSLMTRYYAKGQFRTPYNAIWLHMKPLDALRSTRYALCFTLYNVNNNVINNNHDKNINKNNNYNNKTTATTTKQQQQQQQQQPQQQQ